MKNNKNKLSVASATDSQIKASLRAWIKGASAENVASGLEWYKEAQSFCQGLANEFDLPAYIVASVVSMLSPNNKWERNKVDARAVIIAWKNGLGAESIKVCTYTPNKLKAFRALNEGERIASSAPKTHAFAMNVGLLSSEHITIDKWHIRACLVKPKDGITETVETVTAKQYRRIEAITAQIAKENGLKGYELQAIVWVSIKESWGR